MCGQELLRVEWIALRTGEQAGHEFTRRIFLENLSDLPLNVLQRQRREVDSVDMLAVVQLRNESPNRMIGVQLIATHGCDDPDPL